MTDLSAHDGLLLNFDAAWLSSIGLVFATIATVAVPGLEGDAQYLESKEAYSSRQRRYPLVFFLFFFFGGGGTIIPT